MSHNGPPPSAEKDVGRSIGTWVAGILGTVIATVIAAVVVAQITAGPGPERPRADPGGGQPTAQQSTSADSPHGKAKLYTNKDSGSAGTKLQLSGVGFAPGEDVTLLFHTSTVGHTQADDEGKFSDVSAKVPKDWPFTGQFAFIATGESSLATATREFQVT